MRMPWWLAFLRSVSLLLFLFQVRASQELQSSLFAAVVPGHFATGILLLHFAHHYKCHSIENY